MSHNLVALIAAPALVLWAAVFLLRSERQAAARAFFLLGCSTLWAIGLSAFFTLPMLYEGHLVQLDTLTQFPFRYSDNFASLSDLFFLRTNDYSALLGLRDDTPLQIGWYHWGLALFSLPTVYLLHRSGRRTAATAIALFCAFFAMGIVMSISISEPVWDTFDALRFIQFPWRYLGLVSFATAALAGSVFPLLAGRRPWRQVVFALALLAIFIGSGRMFFRPYYACDLSDGDVLTTGVPVERNEHAVCDELGPSWHTAINDYLPNDVRVVPERSFAPLTVTEGSARLVDWREGTDWLEFDLEASTPTRVEATIFDFPNWEVKLDGERIDHEASAAHGLIALDAPAGTHHFELRLHNTGIRTTANIVSLLSWGALLLAAPAYASWRRYWAGASVHAGEEAGNHLQNDDRNERRDVDHADARDDLTERLQDRLRDRVERLHERAGGIGVHPREDRSDEDRDGEEPDQ
jgi:hypothetical protein